MIRPKIASRFKRAKTMSFFWGQLARLGGLTRQVLCAGRPRIVVGGLALALNVSSVIVAPAHAQGSRKDDIVLNSRGTPLAGATVRVCTMPASGQPCTPLALIYSDIALTQALANPTTTDGLGNYSFHAAPGKYMIEISGPSITTRQIPNVILPSDPTAPNFSSLSSTGNISAFSLNLSGNLTVNGNTTVVGSLAGGTLNLTNQLTPPGAASTGTVNVYTKTDKRLYYKDETGAEIGPIANTSGAQTNISNTWTAAQNFDADVRNKGPNPWFDITRFGGVASTQSTTGSITSGTATLTLAAAQDFANGQGIVVYSAGSLPTTHALVGAPAVALVGVTPGSTTYTYQIACEDYSGGITAAGSSGSVTNSVATLGAQPTVSIAIGGIVRSGGVTTYTTATAHNLVAGQPVFIGNLSSNADQNLAGWLIAATVPTSTTFTLSQPTAPDYTSIGTATAQGLAYNKVTWQPPGTGTFPSTGYVVDPIIHCWIYRNGTLAGVASGVDGYYEDYGFNLTASSAPSYVPTTPPASPIAGYLATTITAGGGTTTLTLAANAGTTVSGKTVLHDNAPALVAATNAATAVSAMSGVVYVPNTGTSTGFLLNSNWVIPSLGVNAVKYVLGGSLVTSQSIIVQTPGVTFEGGYASGQNQTQAFGKGAYSYIGSNSTLGGGFPVFYIPCCRANFTLRRIVSSNSNNMTVLFLMDQAPDGSGSSSIFLDNSYIQVGGQRAVGVMMKGGFGLYTSHTGFSLTNPQFGSAPVVRLTDSAYAVAAGAQIPGIAIFDKDWFGGAGVQLDNVPNASGCNGGGNLHINDTLYESGFMPILRVNVANNCFVPNFSLSSVDTADFLGNWATPMIDINGTANLSGFIIDASTTLNGSMPLIASTSGSPPGGLTIRGAVPVGAGVGSTPYFVFNAGTITGTTGLSSYLDARNTTVVATNSRLAVPLAKPATPTASVSAGGSVPTGTWTYEVASVDWDGQEGPLSLPSAGAVVTSGNQTVTVTCTATATGNIQGFNFYRSNGGGYARTNNGTNLATCSYTDTFSFTQGTTPGTVAIGGDPVISANGLFASKLRLGGELLQASPRAEQNVFLPGALTSTWTGSTWTLDKAITVTRVEVQAKTAPSGCTTNAVVRATDGTTPVNVTISAAANTSGAISQNYAAGSALTISVQTAAAGCGTSPADANVTVQYKMQ